MTFDIIMGLDFETFEVWEFPTTADGTFIGFLFIGFWTKEFASLLILLGDFMDINGFTFGAGDSCVFNCTGVIALAFIGLPFDVVGNCFDGTVCNTVFVVLVVELFSIELNFGFNEDSCWIATAFSGGIDLTFDIDS